MSTSAPTSPPRDAGVAERVRRRTARGAAVATAVALLIALTGWGWPGWFHTWPGHLIGAVAVVIAAGFASTLLRRARLWQLAQRRIDQWVRRESSVGDWPTGWVRGVCGPPKPLHRPASGPQWLRRARRFPAQLVPLRTATGPLAAGSAVLLHARPDGALPVAAKPLAVYAVSAKGPMVVACEGDGLIFVADRWTLAAL